MESYQQPPPPALKNAGAQVPLRSYSMPEASRAEQAKYCRDWILEHQLTVRDGLRSVAANPDVRLLALGEFHSNTHHESYRRAVKDSLAALKDSGFSNFVFEMRANRLAHLRNHNFESGEPLPKVDDFAFWPGLFSPGNREIIAEAKQLGFELFCFEKGNDMGFQVIMAERQNERDLKIASAFLNEISPDSRTIAFYGSAHVHKRAVEYLKDKTRTEAPVTRWVAHVAAEWGDAAIHSVRFQHARNSLDNNHFSSGLLVGEVIDQDQLVFLPDAGPVKGDPLYSATDSLVCSTCTDSLI